MGIKNPRWDEALQIALEEFTVGVGDDPVFHE